MTPIPDRIPPGRIRLTYEDYVELPNDGKRYEILDGDLSVTPAPTTTHQIALMNLAMLLYGHVRAHHLGRVLTAPIDVILADETIAQPDIVFVRADRSSIVAKRGLEGPPDLVVEIVSPTSARQDRTTKAALYARFGVPHYWIVDPEEHTIEIYELANDSYRLVTRGAGEAVLKPSPFPGLSIPLAELWD